MTSIARLPLENPAADPWRQIAGVVGAWATDAGVALRDAVLLVPFAQHLPLARRAFAQAGGWMPRIETTQTLARSLAPPTPPHPAQLSFDAALDRLAARRLLRAQSFGAAWQRRDARGFDHAVNAVVQTAHALARAAAPIAPDERAAHWATAREMLGIAPGPGRTEQLLARIALEWAAASAEPLTDVLFGLRPSAWIVVQAGGPDPLATALAGRGDVPALLVDTDPPGDEPFDALAAQADAALATCADFESEAQRSAAEVVACLNRGAKPVVLIAHDRLLMRRVRALLARQAVPLLDETGWKLSTTRAGATIAGLLRAAMPRASTDDWLDWIKSAAPAWPGRADAGWTVAALESTLRREAWVAPGQVDIDKLHERVAPLWRDAQDIVAGLRALRSRSFAAWLFALRHALAACGAWDSLVADDAGRQAIAALHLDDGGVAASDDGGDDSLSLHEFSAWLDNTLEDAPFVPDAPGVSASGALVVVTPLSRALLRPFAAVVFPGADEKRLGASPPPHPLLSEAQAQALGVPGPDATRQAELLAFAHLLRRPAVTLLRRRDDGGEPLAPSPLLERLQLALQRTGRKMAQAADPASLLSVAAQPVHRPLPVAPAMLPARLSASAYEALRTCPYQFFSMRLLALQEADELADEVDKRDYGNWLHRVLHRFHAERAAPASVEVETAALQAIAQQVREEMALDEASFLPYGATFSRFVPRYMHWLHRRDAEGAQWLDGERELSAWPPSWEGVGMVGTIDRIDSVPGEDGPVTELIDYKTGSAEKLREKVRRPSEDTQLAFYAALMAEQSEAGGPLAAVYLPLDENNSMIRPIGHKQVEHTAVQLVAGVGRDLARLRAGATMPALGEGSVCGYCKARGLCRRDHWPADEEPVA